MLHFPRYGAVPPRLLARLVPALLAVAGTLLLGLAELPLARPGRWFDSAALFPVIGIVYAAAAGLLACHLALLSIAPRPGLTASALPAALIVGAIPGLGSAAVLVALAIAAPAARTRQGAMAVGAVTVALAASWLPSPALHVAGSLAMLAGALLQIRRAARPAVNDNVRNDAFTAFWSLPAEPGCATQPARTSSPTLGE